MGGLLRRLEESYWRVLSWLWDWRVFVLSFILLIALAGCTFPKRVAPIVDRGHGLNRFGLPILEPPNHHANLCPPGTPRR